MPRIKIPTLQDVMFTRNYESHIRIPRASCAKSVIPRCSSKHEDDQHGGDKCIREGFIFSGFHSYTRPVFARTTFGCRSIFIQAGENTCTIDHDGVSSNLESLMGGDKIAINMDGEHSGVLLTETLSEPNSEESESEITLSGEEVLSSTESPLFEVLIKAPSNAVTNVLEKWVEEGNLLGKSEVSVTILNLRKRGFYGKALQFVEWLEATKRLNFIEHHYASHLDLVAKVYGLQKAEKYIDRVPESFRGEVVYRTLLANCVSSLNVKKAEEVLNRIRELGLPISSFSCDQLLFLYKRVNRKKIADVLLMMEKESIKPSYFTYRLLIDLKGRSLDITGMEQIVQKMRGEGMEPDIVIKSMTVSFYINAGLNEKAEAALKDMERSNIKENHEMCKALFPLYASLGKVDDMERIWRVRKDDLRLGEGLVAIEAWGNVGCVEKAEDVFEKLAKSSKKLSSRYYDALLRVYAKHKLLSKGEILVERMKSEGCKVGPSTLEALVELCVEVGEVDKANSTLQIALSNGKVNNPPYRAFTILLDEYSKRGDVPNAERIFLQLKQAGYKNMVKLYSLLLKAYLNAKAPAFGFRERMKADRVFPNKQLAEQLAMATVTTTETYSQTFSTTSSSSPSS